MCISGQLMATHIIGGDVRYRHLGNFQYQVTLTVYRDCFNGIPGFDNPAYVGVFNATGGLITTLVMSNPVVVRLPANATNPCVTVPVSVCVERGVYTTTVTLPPISGGYHLTYQRCCRNNTLLNLMQPGNQGATYTAHIPDVSNFGLNSSPVFNLFPPIGLCVNEPIQFDHSATDLDGDSLAYELWAPFAGAFPLTPAPNPPAPPPYNPVVYFPGYNANYPIAASPPLTINPVTGMLTGRPNLQGQFVVGIRVKEYRNGVLIGAYIRDFQFNVVACPPLAGIQAIIDTMYCSPYRVQFSSTSQSGAFHQWNFGDPTNPTAGSTLRNPNYVYPDTGIYQVRLTVVTALGCRDTAYTTVKVRKGLKANFEADTVCAGEGMVFTDLSVASKGVLNAWWWYFGDGGSGSGPQPTHSYATPGTYQVTLISQTSAGCLDTVTKPVTVYPLPFITAGPDTAVCPGSPVALEASGGVQYLWLPTSSGVVYSGSQFTVSPQAQTTYTVECTDSLGCKSVAMVQVDMLPSPVVTVGPDTTLCPGEKVSLSATGAAQYLWSGAPGISGHVADTLTFSPVGTSLLFVQGTAINGCTASDSVLIQVLPAAVVDAGNDTTLCLGSPALLQGSGAIQYQWTPGNGTGAAFSVAPSVNTTYTLIGTDANGCSAEDSVHVSVLPLPVVVAGPDTSICPGSLLQLYASGAFMYNWQPAGGLSQPNSASPLAIITQPGMFLVTGTDAMGCRNTDSVSVQLLPAPILTVTPDDTTLCSGTSLRLRAFGGLAYTWYPATGLSCTTCPDPQAAPWQTTVYTITATNAYGCISSDTALVEVKPRTRIDISGSAAICDGDTTVLTATGGSSYRWFPGQFTSCDTCATTAIFPDITTTFTVQFKDSFGCNFDTLFAITVLPLPVVQHAPDPASICPGDSVTITLSGAQSYRWVTHPSLSCDTCATARVYPTQSLVFEVEGTNIFGCRSTHLVPVTVHPVPLPALQGDTTVCQGDSVSLASITGVNWTWSSANALLQCTNCRETSVVLNAPATIRLTVIDQNGCRGEDSMRIDLHPAMRIRAEPDTAVCVGDSVWLRANNNLHYQWMGPFPGGVSAPGPLHFAPPLPGWVLCIATDNYGCKGRDSVFVDVLPLPFADAGPDQSTLQNIPVMLQGSGPGSYRWEPAALVNPPHIATPMVSPPASQWFTLWISDVAGCTNYDTVWVEVIDPGEVRIPNAFSPNGDGMNDLFYPVVPIYYDIELFQVFSRWGQLIFEGKGHMAVWDGTFNGQPQPLGTYVYQVQIQTPYGYPIHLKGNVTLVR